MIDLFDYILQRYVNSLGSSGSSAECRVLLNLLNEDGIEIPTDRPRTLFMLLYYLSTLNDATVINTIKSKIDFETISDWDMQDALSIILENKNPSYSWNKTEITKFLINMSDVVENRDSIKSYLILSGYTNAVCDVDELKFQENRKNVIGVYLYKPALTKNNFIYLRENDLESMEYFAYKDTPFMIPSYIYKESRDASILSSRYWGYLMYNTQYHHNRDGDSGDLINYSGRSSSYYSVNSVRISEYNRAYFHNYIRKGTGYDVYLNFKNTILKNIKKDSESEEEYCNEEEIKKFINIFGAYIEENDINVALEYFETEIGTMHYKTGLAGNIDGINTTKTYFAPKYVDILTILLESEYKNIVLTEVEKYIPALKNTMLYAIANNNMDYAKKIVSYGQAKEKRLLFANANVSNVMGSEINAAKKLGNTIVNKITIGTLFNCNRFSDNVKLLEKMINESKKEVNDNV